MEHRVYLELTGDASCARCTCEWQSRTIWFGDVGRSVSASEAQGHWRVNSDNPGLWPWAPDIIELAKAVARA